MISVSRVNKCTISIHTINSACIRTSHDIASINFGARFSGFALNDDLCQATRTMKILMVISVVLTNTVWLMQSERCAILAKYLVMLWSIISE